MDATIKRLWDYGYFFGPKALAVDLMTEDRLPSLQPTDMIVQEAARDWMERFGPELSVWTQRHHQRNATADGFLGPAMADMMAEWDRCGCPDYLHPDEPQEANIPTACRLEVIKSWNFSLPGLSAEQTLQAFTRASQNWMDVLNVGVIQRPGNNGTAHRPITLANLGGSVLADQYLANNSCQQQLRGRFDNRNWNMPLAIATDTHEEGHFWGLPHSNDRSAIMWSSIHSTGINRGGTPNSSDISAMVARGYTRRTSPPPQPDPPTPEAWKTVAEWGSGKFRVQEKTGTGGGWTI